MPKKKKKKRMHKSKLYPPKKNMIGKKGMLKHINYGRFKHNN